MYQYILSGLHIQSEFQFSIAGQQTFDGAPDAIISFGDDIGKPEDPAHDEGYVCANENDVWFRASDALFYRVQNGNRILIQRGKDVSDADVNLYLVGTAFGVLSLQRGLVPFHCSAIEHQQSAIAFTGESGVGKSTLAAALSQQGFAHVCDDVCITDPHDLPLRVRAMPKGLKLWDDAAAELNIDRGVRVSADPDFHKSYVKLPSIEQDKPLLFNRLYVMNTLDAPEFAITKLKGVDKHAEISTAIYREEWLHFIIGRRQAFKLVSDMAAHIDVYRFDRPDDLSRVDESAQLIIDHFKSGLD